MYKIGKVHCDTVGLRNSYKLREESFSSRSSNKNKYRLYLAAPEGSEEVLPVPRSRRTSEQALQVPTKDHRQRSKSPSLQLASDFLYKVLDWFGGVTLEDLSDSYSVLLREMPPTVEINCAPGSCTRASEETTVGQIFLIYNSKDREHAGDAFVKSLSALKLFLSGVSSLLHEEFLKDLFHHHLYGPVSLVDFPEKVIKWNKASTGIQVVIDVNAQYEDGLTALHLACDDGQVDVVEQLLQLGADSSVVDIVGNTAYHLAVAGGHEKCLKVLLDFESKSKGPQWLVEILSVQNKDGHTPLMLATSCNLVPAAVQLLCADADVNATSRETGDSALHIAARKGYLDLTRLLAVFDVALDIRNTSGETALDAAEASKEPGADECYQNLGPLAEGSPFAEDPPVAEHPLDGPVLLSLDGGGIRGLVEVAVLNELESMLMDMDPNFKFLSDYFDWLIGTSTGSFVTIGLAYQKLRPRTIRGTYFKMTEELKKLSPPYPDEGYSEIMRFLFSKDVVLSDVTTPKVAITTTLADRSPPELHLMCNYGEARQGQKGPSERKLWEAARASTAAPTYFEAFENKFIDGGVVSNNPTLDGMTEMVRLQSAEGKQPKIGMVVSLGAGVLASNSIHEISIRRGVGHLVQNLMGYAGILKLIIAQVTQSDGQVVDHARAWCCATNSPFFRFSAPISEIDMTESDIGKIAEMMFQGLLYVKHSKERIRRLAELLIQHKKLMCSKS